MKKAYISPLIAVEATVLPAVMDTLSATTLDFGGGNGGTDGGGLILNSRYDGFGTFDVWDDEEDD